MSPITSSTKMTDASVSQTDSICTLKPTAWIQISTPAEQNSAIAALVLAFSNDPVARWLFPNPDQYLTDFPPYVRALGDKAFEQGTAYLCRNYSGAALWLPPGVESDTQRLIDLLQQSLPQSRQQEVLAFFEQVDRYYPKFLCWYLPFIGVDPSQQGKGYGSALLQPILEQCDRDRTPAYLENSNPANIAFYERHGFEVIGTIPARGSPQFFSMIRQPQT